jgi:CDP-glycerol glycerophosphotransferase (TagB/SpsB family)
MNRTFINLFHAIAVKKVGIQSDKRAYKESLKWNYFLVSSPFEGQFIKEQYKLNSNQILNFGQPRNDILCTNIKPKGVNSSKKRILYAPTFRSEKSTRLFPFENMDLSEFDRFLENANIEIIIRLHINDEKRYIKNEEYLSLKRIKFSGSNITPSINDILYSFDAVISDYSSITIDFLLLNKPIGYIPYDYDAYEKERGFSFEYHEHLSGPVIENQKDLEDFLLDSGTEHAPKRNKMRDKFHYHQDGNSSKRMYNFINTL